MKFSKSKLILAILGVVVIGAVIVGMVQSQQSQKQQELKTALLLAQKKLAQIEIDELTLQQEQIAREKELYTTKIAYARSKLAAPIDSIAATDTILQSAHDFDLRIVNINCSGNSNKTLANNKFTVLPFNVQVEGPTDNIAAFVSNIKTLFPTSVVETYQFNIGPSTQAPSPSSQVNSSADGSTPPTGPTPNQPAETPAATPEIVFTPITTTLLPTDTMAAINIIIYDYKGD